MNKPGYETFEHGADIGIRGRGHTLEEAFVNGARALFSVVLQDLDAVQPRVPVPVQATSYDRAGLFVAWLNALLAEADMKKMLFCTFEVNINGLALSGTAWGEDLDAASMELGVEVKGATFTELVVQRTNRIWTAQCVVDV